MKFLSYFIEHATFNKTSVIESQVCAPSPNEESPTLTQWPERSCGCLAQYMRHNVTIIMIPKFHNITLVISPGLGNSDMLTILSRNFFNHRIKKKTLPRNLASQK